MRTLRQISVLLVLGALALACSEAEPARMMDQPVGSTIEDSLATAFQADRSWHIKLDSTFNRVFSIELEEWLVAIDRPVVALLELADIRRASDGYYGLFEPSVYGPYGFTVYFDLKLTPEQVQYFLTGPREPYITTVVAVAKVDSIARPLIGVSASADGYGSISHEPESISYAVARGHLIHALIR